MAARRLECRHCHNVIRFIGKLPEYCHYCGRETHPPARGVEAVTEKAIESLTENRN